ncbi:MAG TPA: GWxTD domain-containing protein [Cyclobacteriaceae bacterium]|nr:GWxTD domain-containing protein [Cyclobacteriaceae bacterium]
MKFVALSICLLLTSLGTVAQSISSANFRYWYDPDNAGQLSLKVVRSPDSVYAYFEIDTTIFDVSWENRDSYGQREGKPVDATVTGTEAHGRMAFPLPQKPWLLVARLTDKRTQEIRMDFRLIENNYPPDGVIWQKNKPVFASHIAANTEATITNNFGPDLKVYHYAERFPAASPPFAEKEKPVDPIMEVDSVFSIRSGQPLKLAKEGLYLVQSDTNAARGIAFRVSPASYPRMTKVEDLSTSLVFISTKEEADKLAEAGSDKTKFDRVVLEITHDKNRAKDLIRNYFRRVELANIYFTSYKEGWKTDRGMMYLIFGVPDEVNRNGQFEVWSYKKMNAKFTFVRTGSVFDPDYYVLERNKRFSETWYYTIDMWRKSQISSVARN